jgi:Ca2+/Na+ antiporter
VNTILIFSALSKYLYFLYFQMIYYLCLYGVILCALDDRSSSVETETENIPDGNHYSLVIDEEEQENWDSTEDANDNFDPTCKLFYA